MKKLGLFSLILPLFLLTSCNDDQSVPGLEGSFDALSCTKSSVGCGVDWFFTFKKGNFPDNAQILINDKIIIDECDPKSWWSVNGETSKEIEFKVADYVNIDGTEKFNMRVFDRMNCSAPKEEHSYSVKQNYDIKNIGGEKQVWVY